MNLNQRIEILIELGKRLTEIPDEKIEFHILKAYQENQWFTPDNTRKSIKAISTKFLTRDSLESWVSNYHIDQQNSQRVGLILPGNIPLVGFHDILCAFICGFTSIIKPSSKDSVLIKAILDILIEIDPAIAEQVDVVDRLNNFDAIIATGSNSSALHFEYYFRKYPKLIRKNRTSIAIIDGTESEKNLKELASDVFDYFGLGCRSISKIYVPEGYDLDNIFGAFYDFIDVINHNKYKNNYDYNNAIFMMGQEHFLTNGFIILKKDKNVHSRIASLHYEHYSNPHDLLKELEPLHEQVQCISSNMVMDMTTFVPLGKCQQPELYQYADGVDTMKFLTHQEKR